VKSLQCAVTAVRTPYAVIRIYRRRDVFRYSRLYSGRDDVWFIGEYSVETYNIIIICVHTWSKAHTTVYCSVARGSGSMYSGQRHIIFLSRSVWTEWKNKIKSFQLFIRAN